MKFCKVDEPETSRLPAVSRDVMNPFVALNVVAKKFVEVPFPEAKKLPLIESL